LWKSAAFERIFLLGFASSRVSQNVDLMDKEIMGLQCFESHINHYVTLLNGMERIMLE
jgi:hypothetical protein